jgi:hypothetical protein
MCRNVCRSFSVLLLAPSVQILFAQDMGTLYGLVSDPSGLAVRPAQHAAGG